MLHHLRLLRIAKGLSQAQLGQAAGCSQSTISSWENGYTTPDDDVITRAAQALGVPPEHLRHTDARSIVITNGIVRLESQP